MDIIKCRVGICDDRAEDRERIEEAFDLLLLDIEMLDLDGFKLAEKICMNPHSFYLIFVSAHESFVFDASEYMPLWFVRKSNLEWDMFRAVRKYMQIASCVRVNYRIREGFGFRKLPEKIRQPEVYGRGIGRTLFPAYP